MHKVTLACCWGLTLITLFAGYQLRAAARIMKDQREQVADWRTKFIEMDAKAHEATGLAHEMATQADALAGLGKDVASQRDEAIATAQKCVRLLERKGHAFTPAAACWDSTRMLLVPCNEFTERISP